MHSPSVLSLMCIRTLAVHTLLSSSIIITCIVLLASTLVVLASVCLSVSTPFFKHGKHGVLNIGPEELLRIQFIYCARPKS